MQQEETRIVPMEHIRTAMQKAGASFGSPRTSEPPAPTKPLQETVWDALPVARLSPAHLEGSRIVTLDKNHQVGVAYDMLRTRVLQRLRENNWTSIAITSPTAGGGKSSLALNLAFSLSNRPDCRIALLDFDLRCPTIGTSLGIPASSPIEEFIRGTRSFEQSFKKLRDNLAVATNGRPVEFAAELLQSPEAVRCVTEVREKLSPDVILYDLPPMLAADDVMAFLPNVDCAILVVEAEKNTPEQVAACEYELSSRSKLLGVILNKCRHAVEAQAYGYGG